MGSGQGSLGLLDAISGEFRARNSVLQFQNHPKPPEIATSETSSQQTVSSSGESTNIRFLCPIRRLRGQQQLQRLGSKPG